MKKEFWASRISIVILAVCTLFELLAGPFMLWVGVDMFVMFPIVLGIIILAIGVVNGIMLKSALSRPLFSISNCSLTVNRLFLPTKIYDRIDNYNVTRFRLKNIILSDGSNKIGISMGLLCAQDAEDLFRSLNAPYIPTTL